MKIEILKVTPTEICDLLSAINKVDAAKLLIQSLSLLVSQIDDKAINKILANELADYCEDLVFASDAVIDAINESICHEQHFYFGAAEIADFKNKQDLEDLYS